MRYSIQSGEISNNSRYVVVAIPGPVTNEVGVTYNGITYINDQEFFGVYNVTTFTVQGNFAVNELSVFKGIGIELITLPQFIEHSKLLGIGIELAAPPIFPEHSKFLGVGIELITSPIFPEHSKILGIGLEATFLRSAGFAYKINYN